METITKPIVGKAFAAIKAIEDRAIHYYEDFQNREFAKLDGKTVLITGGSSGTGMALAAECGMLNAKRVIFTSRDKTRGMQVLDKLEKQVKGYKNFEMQILDLNDFSSVKALCERIDYKIDVLVLNAGIVWTEQGSKSVDGFDEMLQSNVLGHIYLTDLWIAKCQRKRFNLPRVVILSSFASIVATDLNKNNFFELEKPIMQKYSQTKLMNCLQAAAYAKENPDLVIHSVHPGFVKTAFFNKMPIFQKIMFSLFMFSIGDNVSKGAKKILYMVTQPQVEKQPSGSYWWAYKPRQGNSQMYDPQLCKNFLQYCRSQIEKVT